MVTIKYEDLGIVCLLVFIIIIILYILLKLAELEIQNNPEKYVGKREYDPVEQNF